MGVRYPVVRLVEAQRYVLRRQSGELGTGDLPEFEEEGANEAESVLPAVKEMTDRLYQLYIDGKARFTSAAARDAFEGNLAVQVHERFRSFPPHVLTDDDFWRFVSVRSLYDFIAWRDGQGSGSPALASFGASSQKVSYDCVPFRMFVRADIASIVAQTGSDTIEPVEISAIAGTDVWRSHILRSQSSFAPHYVRMLLEHVDRKLLPSTVVRDLAKRVRRVRSNVLIEALDMEATAVMFAREFRTSAGEDA